MTRCDPSNNTWISACLAVLAIALAPTASLARKNPETPPDAGLNARDPAAIALRDRIVRTYRDLHAIHEKITQRQWRTSRDEALTVEIELRYRKPNRLYLAIDYPYVEKPGRWQLIYACDGKSLTIFNSAHNEYQTIKSPARLDKLLLPQALIGPEFIPLLRDISPFEELEKSAIVRYTESYDEGANGSRHTLRVDLQQDGSKRNLRYQAGVKDNLIHGVTVAVVPDTDAAASPFADPIVRSNVEAKYTLVDVNPRFSDADFRFIPPAGAVRRKGDLEDAYDGGGKARKPEGKRQP